MPHVLHIIWPVVGAVALFGGLFTYFRLRNRTAVHFYFDPQDFAYYEGPNPYGRKLPIAAIKGQSTFEPLLKSYIEVMKLLITVAAASVAFGNQHPIQGVVIAKIILAFAILYGVLFAALLQFFYDEYTQDAVSYSPFRYSLIESLGFSALVCFIGGYFVWAFNLGG